jgi:hypothetical protein
MIVKPCRYRSHSDLGSFLNWIAVNAGADGRETDALNVAFGSQLEAVEIAGFKQLRLTMLAVTVYRSDGVEDVFSRKPPRASHNGIPRITPANPSTDLIQLAHDCRSAGSVNRAINPAASGQLRVRSIHNCIDSNIRDVTPQQLKLTEAELNDKVGRHALHASG